MLLIVVIQIFVTLIKVLTISSAYHPHQHHHDNPWIIMAKLIIETTQAQVKFDMVVVQPISFGDTPITQVSCFFDTIERLLSLFMFKIIITNYQHGHKENNF